LFTIDRSAAVGKSRDGETNGRFERYEGFERFDEFGAGIAAEPL
jgi:hypothetical protein